ncbi:MAG: glycogen/starch synthase, partial [Clostridia bacterium]|nr:glycogen/starch synthase [Clostridia bacterium]
MAASTTKKTTTKTTAAKTTAPAAEKKVTKTAAVKPEDKKKILFVASEATPFIQTGGLAEVIGSLSTALAKTGKFDVRVVIPL